MPSELTHDLCVKKMILATMWRKDYRAETRGWVRFQSSNHEEEREGPYKGSRLLPEGVVGSLLTLVNFLTRGQELTRLHVREFLCKLAKRASRRLVIRLFSHSLQS